ncbi:MAG: DUF3795 domain-containing protein [Candidatus Cloacimonadaceae bacterium]
MMNRNDIKACDVLEDSYCGLYCGACEILIAYTKALELNRGVTWEDLPKEFSSYITEAEVKCLGCKTETVFEGCQRCPIRSCAREKGVEYCIDCEFYPCDLINQMLEQLIRIKSVLPHTSGIIGNLEEIKKMGRVAWLKHQKKLWSCPTCGSRFSWYQNKCTTCRKT